jgi:hypothetical protein
MRKREGIEPRYGYAIVGADMLSFIEGNIKGADETKAPANSLGSKTWHVTKAVSGTWEVPWVLPGKGEGRHNRTTGRKPHNAWEVGCPRTSDEVG